MRLYYPMGDSRVKNHVAYTNKLLESSGYDTMNPLRYGILGVIATLNNLLSKLTSNLTTPEEKEATKKDFLTHLQRLINNDAVADERYDQLPNYTTLVSIISGEQENADFRKFPDGKFLQEGLKSPADWVRQILTDICCANLRETKVDLQSINDRWQQLYSGPRT